MSGLDSVAEVATLRAPRTYRVPVTARLPYPLRDAMLRWKSLLGMMVGVGIALGISMTIMGVSAAEEDLFTADYTKAGANLYVVTEGGKLIAILPGDSPGTIKRARGMLAQTRGIVEVKAAIGLITWPMERQTEGPHRRDAPTEIVTTVGVDGDPSTISGAMVMSQGRWVRRSDEIVLGPKISKEKGLVVGSSVRLAGRDFTVVGIGRVRGAGYNSDSMAFMERTAFEQRAGIGDIVNLIMIETAQPDVVRQKVAEMGSFSISDPAQLVKQGQDINSSAVGLRLVLVWLTLAIAGLFVSNMLLRSVAERRLEFATLRAIGVPTRTILLTIGAQAMFISLAAGVVGVAEATVLGSLINVAVAPQYGFDSLYTADAGLFALVFLLSLGLGLVAGLFPARQATRVDPALVLREA